MDSNFLSKRNQAEWLAVRPFSFPHEVIEDQSLNLDEKRAILSEWASDACAIESFPTLRLLPGTSFPVTFSAIMNAREQLERRIISREQYGENYSGPLGEVVIADFERQKHKCTTKPNSRSKNCPPSG